MDSSDSSLL